MARPLFSVTYDRTTDADAEIGEPGESGFLGEGLGLREAVETLLGADAGLEAIEADSMPFSAVWPPRWFTAYYGRDMHDGACETRSLHFPERVSPSSRVRLGRVLRVHGAAPLHCY